MSVKIRTKSRPWQEVEVSEAAALDLERRGALAEDKPAPKKAAPRKRAPRKKATTTTAAPAATDTSKEG